MAKKILDFFSFKVIFVFIPIILVTAFKPQIGLSQEALDLSGRYKGYNVILIILDALRPDHLSCYGYNKKTSPNIDALAKQGVLFTNAFSQATITLPGVTSIFTSLYPYSHRVVHIFKDKVSDNIYTLAQVLEKYGYNTVWFGGTGDPHSGGAQGLLKGYKEKCHLGSVNISEDKEKISRWIKFHWNELFFITMHYYSMHDYYFPFAKSNNKFFQKVSKELLGSIDSFDKKSWDKAQDELKDKPEKFIAILGEDWVKKKLMHKYSPGDFRKLFGADLGEEQIVFLDTISKKVVGSFFETMNKDQLLSFLSLFDSAIYEFDKNMIGQMVKELKELKLYDKTIIIITADHGNLFAEHGLFGKGSYLYEEAIRVPLIIYAPNLKEAKVVKELVQSIDILPTTLDLLSIPILHQAQGISQAGVMEGRKDALTNEYVFSQGIPASKLAIRSKDWKLIRKPQENKDSSDIFELSLFDLRRDPRELHNVINDKPQVAGRLRNELDEWMKGLVVYQEEKSEFIPSLDEETKQRIKKTGYW